MKFVKLALSIGFILTFVRCDNVFDYSVYGAEVRNEDKNSTARNITLIKNLQPTSNSFKFAFITDIHYYYTNFRKVIDDINKNEDILFVIIGGDMTEQAVLKEYEIFYDIIDNLKKPYLTVIGNHDYKSNGAQIYNAMFGSFNYSFYFDNKKFVFFDNIVWESKKNPDFTWLSKELENSNAANQVFVFAHIPPNGDQFTEEMRETYTSILENQKVTLSTHGHTHNYYFKQNTVSYLTGPSVKEAAYCLVEVSENSFNVSLVEL
ncbi:metallophosphoesterase family protein [Polaribacter tangerinus]|uniref:metallophosphoesterase family protein n=1 Tax=Polaribacter tangerinus TaxID=1920034 RepID=UPI000B4A9AD4|nr:metallophosphoesterase [Polaribacter tangerinus]